MNTLILSSSNRNFPLDIHNEITKAGQSAFRFSNMADFLASPLRRKPYLAVVEIGNPEDINRAILAYEWAMSEEVPNRFLLLLASKYLQLGEKALRLAGTESATLPMPNKNLLFKIELQLKLLVSEKPKAVTNSLVFKADIPELIKTRVLKFKGPLPNEGKWNRESKDSPSGKIRWRWVRAELSDGKETDKALPTWTLESNTAPVYLQEEKAWKVEDSSANMLSFYGEEEIYSLKKQLEESELADQVVKENTKGSSSANELEQIARINVVTDAKADSQKITQKPAGEHQSSEAKAKPQIQAGSRDEGKNARTPGELIPAQESADKNPRERPTAAEKTKTPWERPEAVAETKTAKTKDTPERAPLAKEESTWREKASPTIDPVSTPGEDRRDTQFSDKQAGAQMGSIEEAQKKAKYSITEEDSTITDKRKLEVLIEESLAPRSAQITEEDAKVKERKSSFEMNERNKRQVLAEQEEIEGKRKSAGEMLESPAEVSPKRSTIEEVEPEQRKKTQDIDPSTKAARHKTNEPKTPTDVNEKNRDREAIAKPELEGSFQSVASSYYREKEVSKKIITDSHQNIDPSGKIEVEIPADPQKLETVNRIAQYPPKLEVEQTFSKDADPARVDSDFLKSRHFEILTLAQLNDKNSTWQPVDQFRVYISAQHRYYGIKDVRDVFPLWIYSGELAPEFLDLEKAWKFYDRAPQRFLLNDPLPIAVARFIQKMAGIPEDQLAEMKQKPQETTTQLGIAPAFDSFAHEDTTERTAATSGAAPLPAQAPEEKEKNLFQYLKKVLGFGK